MPLHGGSVRISTRAKSRCVVWAKYYYWRSIIIGEVDGDVALAATRTKYFPFEIFFHLSDCHK